MRSWTVIVGLTVGVAMSAVVSAQGQGGATLTPQDYAEIRELYSRFVWSIDTGSDNGMAYARTFAPNGEFRYGNNSVVGHEKLAELNRNTNSGGQPRHYTTNILVEPSPEGARVVAYHLLIGLPEEPDQSPPIGTGTYEDILVKISEGWRIKQRILYQNAMPPSGVMVSVSVPAQQQAGTTLILEDRDEIEQLYARYAWTSDSRPVDGLAWAKLFTPDGEFNTGSETIVGREQLAEYMPTAAFPFDAPAHYLMNLTIEPSPEGVNGRVYLALIFPTGQTGRYASTIRATVTYHDTLVKTSEGWRFKRRRLHPSTVPPPAN